MVWFLDSFCHILLFLSYIYIYVVKKWNEFPPTLFGQCKHSPPPQYSSKLLFFKIYATSLVWNKKGHSRQIYHGSVDTAYCKWLCICYDMFDRILYDTKVGNSFCHRTTLLEVYKRSLSYTCGSIFYLEIVGKLDTNIYSN